MLDLKPELSEPTFEDKFILLMSSRRKFLMRRVPYMVVRAQVSNATEIGSCTREHTDFEL